jgi:nucleolar protein 16
VRASRDSTEAKFAISNVIPKAIVPTEARVERDEAGRIVRVHHQGGHGKHKDNPLNDPLNSDEEDEDMQSDGPDGQRRETSSENAIVKALQEQAALIPEKKVRQQSQREKEWIQRLAARYGADFAAMARDRKLNPMQQTEADIRRRVERWRADGGVVDA